MRAARSVEEAVSEYVDLVVAFYRRAPFRIGTQLEALVEAEHDPEMRDSAAMGAVAQWRADPAGFDLGRWAATTKRLVAAAAQLDGGR